MARKYAAFCLVEESLFAAALCCLYAAYPDRAEQYQASASILAFLAAASVSNVAIYLENREVLWSGLGLGRKVILALEAIATAFIAFCAGFAILGMASGHAMGPRSLAMFAAMAGFDFGFLGLAGFHLANSFTEGVPPWLDAGRAWRRLRERRQCDMEGEMIGMCPLNESERKRFGIPGGLAQAMAEIAAGGGLQSVEAAVRILRKEIALTSEGAGRSEERGVMRAMACVDLFIMRCIIDEDGYLELWEESAEAISELLSETEQLLQTSLSESGVRLPDHKTHRSDMTLTSLRQRLDAYLCIAAGYAKNDREFEERLCRVSSATVANVDHLLSHWNSEDLARMENVGRYGYYEPGTRYWTEPLALLSYAAVSIRKAREIRRAYERYIEHLEKAGANLEGIRARLLLDAELTMGNLLGDSIEEIYPEYPLDFSATDGIRRLVADNPGLPIVVFAGPEGTGGTYCEIDGAEVVDLLNRGTHYYSIANVATSREELVSAIARDIRDLGCVEGFDESWTDEQIDGAAKKEADKFEEDWVPAIAIYASWKDL